LGPGRRGVRGHDHRPLPAPAAVSPGHQVSVGSGSGHFGSCVQMKARMDTLSEAGWGVPGAGPGLGAGGSGGREARVGGEGLEVRGVRRCNVTGEIWVPVRIGDRAMVPAGAAATASARIFWVTAVWPSAIRRDPLTSIGSGMTPGGLVRTGCGLTRTGGGST